MQNIIRERIIGSISLKRKLLDQPDFVSKVEKAAIACIKAFSRDHKVLFCGNGGSAADAQHLAAEFSGRFYYDREPLDSEALHVNTSYLTAVANDYSYDEVYARLVKAKGSEGDILFAISTSGNSKNILNAIVVAKKKGMTIIGMTGEGGGKMSDKCDILLSVPSKDTPRIQECHILAGHIICELVESALFPKP